MKTIWTKSFFIRFLLISLLVLILGCSTGKVVSDFPQQNKVGIGINKGDIAPDFALETVDGQFISLSSFQHQKPIVLYFWATWCPFCKRDFDTLKKVYPSYKNDVAFIAVDLDLTEGPQIIKEYQKKNELTESGILFALGDASVLNTYQVHSTTTKFLINRHGIIRYSGSGAQNEQFWHTALEGLRKE